MSTGKEVAGWEMIAYLMTLLRCAHKERIEKMKIKLWIMLMSQVCLCFRNKLELSTMDRGKGVINSFVIHSRGLHCFPDFTSFPSLINPSPRLQQLISSSHFVHETARNKFVSCQLSLPSSFGFHRNAISRHQTEKFNQSTEHSTFNSVWKLDN